MRNHAATVKEIITGILRYFEGVTWEGGTQIKGLKILALHRFWRINQSDLNAFERYSRNSLWNNTIYRPVRSFPARLQSAVCFRIMLRQGTLPPSAVAHKTPGALLLKLQTKLCLGCQPTRQTMRCSKQMFALFGVPQKSCFVAWSELVTMIPHKIRA